MKPRARQCSGDRVPPGQGHAGQRPRPDRAPGQWPASEHDSAQDEPALALAAAGAFTAARPAGLWRFCTLPAPRVNA